MILCMRIGMACVVLLGLGLGARAARPEGEAGTDPVQELALATQEARKAPKGEKTVVKRLDTVVRALTPRVDALRATVSRSEALGRDNAIMIARWNDALTTLRWHGATAPAYAVVSKTTFAGFGLQLSYPYGTRWTYQYSGKNDQLLLTLTQKSLDGAVLSVVKFWTYRWDTTYSGVGGENYVKLAKTMLEVDREAMVGPGAKASPRVIATSLSPQFPRAQFYFVEGDDADEEARVRRLNYYLKDGQRTYNVEMIVRTEAQPEEDPLTLWQRTDADPERGNLLKTLSSVEDGK